MRTVSAVDPTYDDSLPVEVSDKFRYTIIHRPLLRFSWDVIAATNSKETVEMILEHNERGACLVWDRDKEWFCKGTERFW
jgi:hypothetical protein